MAEKTLNTRIGLKIDTLERWNASTLPLLKGEVAIATVAAGAGTGLTEPVCMIKVGEDGVKTFKDLDWTLHAKASDVLAACKSEAGLKAFVNGVIADAGIATNEAMEALAGRVTTAEGAIDILKGDGDGSVAKAITDAIAALDLANTYQAKGEYYTKTEADEAFTNSTEVDSQIDAKITALDLANTYQAKGEYYTKTEADEAFTTEAEVKSIAATEINTLIGGVSDTDTIENITTLVNYVNEHGADTAALVSEVYGSSETTGTSRIDTLEGEIDILAGDEETEGSIAKDIKDAIEAENLSQYVKKDEAVGYGDILTKTAAAEAYQAKGEYYTKTEADEAFTNSTEVDGQIDAKITALDLANTYQAKGEYATAAQGAKADTALQKITTTEGKGLKVTNGNNIDIDDTVTFVFDCGNSGVAE